jgi:hypothetical protein
MNIFLAAIEALKRRIVTPSAFNSRQWATVASAFRNRAFFSATVTSAKVLNKMRNTLLDWMQSTVEEVVNVNTGARETVFKESSVAKFKEKVGDLMINEGLAKPSDFGDNRITNVVGQTRLNLIFNTNTEQAATFADWQMKISDEAWLNRYPAAEFVRRPGAIIKRPLHVQNEGAIRRYDDLDFWLYMNNAEIGGFQVPWGPYGFNSYMTQKPVKRAIAEKLGLVKPGERIKSPNVKFLGVDLKQQFNANVTAEMDDVTPEIRKKAQETIVARLGPTALDRNGNVTLDTLKQLRDAINY